jgi:hypothetical protein
MEGAIVLATILRSWRVRLPEGAGAMMPIRATVNLRPEKGATLMLERR